MALGGWKYYPVTLATAAQSVVNDTAFLNQILNGLASDPGWSVTTTATQYGTIASVFRTQYYGVVHHSGGADVVFVWDSYGSGTVIHADNMYDGITISASSSYLPMLFVAYLPAGHSGTTGLPLDSGFIPSDGFKFVWCTYQASNNTLYTANSIVMHYMVRGDDFALAIEFANTVAGTINSLSIYGDVFDKLHASDSYSEGVLSWYNGLVLNTGWQSVQLRTAAGDLIIRKSTVIDGIGIYLLVESAIYASDVCNSAPWNWAAPVVYLQSSDLGTDGIIAGDGIKGTLDPELLRLSSSAITEKQRLTASSEFIHLVSGFILGYDSTNAGMS